MARIRVQATSDLWVKIELGPKRAVRCSCSARGEATDRPAGVGGAGFTRRSRSCQHIDALYLGRVTEDKRAVLAEEATWRRERLLNGLLALRQVKFTELGEKMFRWRLAQIALERST